MRRLLLVALLVGAARLTSAAELPTRIELYTMGSGDDVFEAFGHSTLCVVSDEFPSGACYNYGTTDFASPVGLIWEVLRGRAVFWVARTPLPLMLQAYAEDDRTTYRQELDLPTAQAEELAARLERDLLPEHRTYVYHHYRDNCATRLRDHLDVVTGGALSRGADGPVPETFRHLTQRGFASSLLLLSGMEVLVGWRVDRRPTLWEAMFLPAVLRAEVARRFGAPPELLYERKGPVPELSPVAGRTAVWVLALCLSLLVGAAALWRPWAFPFRVALAATGLFLGLLGFLVAATALVAVLPELRQNEALLVFLPTDVLVAFLHGRPLFVYLAARCVLAAVVAIGLVVGILAQPMWAAWALATGPLALATWRAAR
jgi:hypothetical protein